MGGIGQAMRLITITLLAFALTLGDAVADEADAERYTIRDGVIGPQVVTILLDRMTGRTWMLKKIGTEVVWEGLTLGPRPAKESLDPISNPVKESLDPPSNVDPPDIVGRLDWSVEPQSPLLPSVSPEYLANDLPNSESPEGPFKAWPENEGLGPDPSTSHGTPPS